VRVGVKPGQYGWGYLQLHQSWVAAEQAGFDLVACFDHVSAAPRGIAAWDAPSLLTAMAAATERILISVEVVNASLRNPFLLAGQLAVAQAASGGRLRVGLGAGSAHLARFDHNALGVPFPEHDQRVRHLESCSRVLPALWRGAVVDEPSLGLRQASLGPIEITPPELFIGGASDAVLQIAARHANGWHTPADPERFPALARRLDQICEGTGRDQPIEKAAQVFLEETGLDGASDALRRFEDAGASSVTFILHNEHGTEWVRRLGGQAETAVTPFDHVGGKEDEWHTAVAPTPP
jgi:alkanesulfonate monooxygenase SsuD/methylene tetrahydromethanopterin reductase-like flavin-dependent oxidoreductase (luciferase family)